MNVSRAMVSPNNSHDLFETGKSTLLSLDEFAELIVNFRAPWWRDNQDEVFKKQVTQRPSRKWYTTSAPSISVCHGFMSGAGRTSVRVKLGRTSPGGQGDSHDRLGLAVAAIDDEKSQNDQGKAP